MIFGDSSEPFHVRLHATPALITVYNDKSPRPDLNQQPVVLQTTALDQIELRGDDGGVGPSRTDKLELNRLLQVPLMLLRPKCEWLELDLNQRWLRLQRSAFPGLAIKPTRIIGNWAQSSENEVSFPTLESRDP